MKSNGTRATGLRGWLIAIAMGGLVLCWVAYVAHRRNEADRKATGSVEGLDGEQADERALPLAGLSRNEHAEFIAEEDGFAARFPGAPQRTNYGLVTNYAVVVQNEAAYNVHVKRLRTQIDDQKTDEFLEGAVEGRLLVHGGKLLTKRFVNLLGHRAVKYEYTAPESGTDAYFKGVQLCKGKLAYTVSVVCFRRTRALAYEKYAAFLKSFRLLE